MKRILNRPRIEKQSDPDNPRCRWVLVCDYVALDGHVDKFRMPVSSQGGANILRDYVAKHHELPSRYADEDAARVLAYEEAFAAHQDCWVPACGGMERPYRAKNGRRVLYCYNPGKDQHDYLDMDGDRFIAPDERADYGLA